MGLFSKRLVPFQVTICGIGELGLHCEAGVTHVLSLLDPGSPEPEAFGIFDPHRRLELRFHDVIDADPGCVPPERPDVEQLLSFGRDLANAKGAHILVHCHAGVSRSTAAATLILVQARPDRPAEEAQSAHSRARRRAPRSARRNRRGGARALPPCPRARALDDRADDRWRARPRGGRSRQGLSPRLVCSLITPPLAKRGRARPCRWRRVSTAQAASDPYAIGPGGNDHDTKGQYQDVVLERDTALHRDEAS